MITYIDSLIGCIINFIGCWIAASIVFKEKIRADYKSILIILLFSVIITCANFTTISDSTKTIKMLFSYFGIAVLYKNSFKKKVSDTIIGTTLVYCNLFIAELLVVTVVLGISNLINKELMDYLAYSLIANLTTILGSLLLVNVLKNIYIKLYNKIAYNDISLIISNIIIVVIISVLLTTLPLEINIQFILTIILILMFIFVTLYMLKQKNDIHNAKKEYMKLVDYSRINEAVLEQYRMSVHENKNQLILIDGMIPKKYKEVHEYINNLINNKSKNKYYYISELKYLPYDRLKSFINHKLLEMLYDDINVEINIDKQVPKSYFDTMTVQDREDIYTILGVILDNAHEAAKESKEKIVSIGLYKRKDEYVAEVANTFNGSVDLNRIENYGYTSKGSGHGTGLHIVKNIINHNDIYSKNTIIEGNYFIQEISIKKRTKK